MGMIGFYGKVADKVHVIGVYLPQIVQIGDLFFYRALKFPFRSSSVVEFERPPWDSTSPVASFPICTMTSKEGFSSPDCKASFSVSPYSW